MLCCHEYLACGQSEGLLMKLGHAHDLLERKSFLVSACASPSRAKADGSSEREVCKVPMRSGLMLPATGRCCAVCKELAEIAPI